MMIGFVTGNLGQDAELRTTQGGSVCSFSVATSRRTREGEETTWVRCSMWGKRGESVAVHLSKGVRVAVSGELSLSEYNGKQRLELKVSELDFMGSRERGGSRSRDESTASRGQAAPDDDIPF